MLYGTAEQEPQAELVAQLAQEMYHQNMLLLLVQNLNRIDFEVRRVSQSIFLKLLHIQVGLFHWNEEALKKMKEKAAHKCSLLVKL